MSPRHSLRLLTPPPLKKICQLFDTYFKQCYTTIMLKRISLLFFFVSLVLLGFSTEAATRPINDVYVIHFIIDGTNKRFFDQVLESGKLPTIQKHFVENGAVFTHALANFPSTSTTIYQSYNTGLLPGHAGIPHLERFDRQKQEVIGYLTASGYLKINTDFINMRSLLNPNVAKLNPPSTIFELLEGYPTLSLYASFRRGASLVFPKFFPLGSLWSAYARDSGERIDLYAFDKLFEFFKKDNPPRYTIVGLYSTDFLGHKYGAQSEWVEDTLIQFDIFLKEFLELLKEKGLDNKIYFIVSADHGMHNTSKRFELREPLRKAGIFVKPRSPKIKDYTLYIADRGVSSTHIYVKHNDGWEPVKDASILRQHPKIGGGTVDLIETILNLEPTLLLIARDGPHAARIFDGQGGQSRIECFTLNYTDWCSYQVSPGQSDPLKLKGKTHLTHLMDGEPHSTFAWKKAMAGEEYPDAVIQLSQIFFDGRAGDIFVIPKKEWGFRKIKAGTHGSIVEGDMRVPLLIAGPTVPQGTFGIMRSPDVYPLLLEWFGITIPKENYDGVNPFKPIPNETKDWQHLAKLEQAVAHSKKLRAHGKTLKLARQEYKNRQLLFEKLTEEEKKIQTEDHLDIIKRMIALTKERLERMKIIME